MELRTLINMQTKQTNYLLLLSSVILLPGKHLSILEQMRWMVKVRNSES